MTEVTGLLGANFRKLSLLFTAGANVSFLRKSVVETSPERRRIVILGTGDSGKTVLAQKVMLGLQPNVQPNISPEDFRQRIMNPVLDEAVFVLKLLEKEGNTDTKSLMQSVIELRQQEGSRNFEEFAKLILEIFELPDIENLLKHKYINFRQSKPRRLIELVKKLQSSDQNLLDWVPSTNEILLHVPSTTGLSSSACMTADNNDLIEVYDFGGIISERKKWKILVRGIKADTSPHSSVLIFASSLADFDAPLFEKQTVTRLQDSIDAFASLIADTDIPFRRIYLTFTKKDLLHTTLNNENTILYLQTLGYTGNTEEEFLTWLEARFLAKTEDIVALRGNDFIKTVHVSSFDSTSCNELSDELHNDLV